MSRSLSILSSVLALAWLVMASATIHAAPQHGDQHASQLTKCAKVCADCQLECDSCFAHCLKLLADGKKEHAATAQLCADCAECCKTCATLCARQSPLAAHMLECCAKCCDQCAEACAKYTDDEHMAKCAKACQECAKHCRETLKQLGK